ncbi:hypothetical protein KEM52_005811 [Ascosphaera acerosa]|nr:hypothetical protein KEM52_005811 [Ascosphaera acerosa]
MVTTATSGKSGSASAGMAETDRGLTPAETTLLAHAALGRIDRSSLSEKEEEALALFDLIEEQRLERALLLQDHDDLDVGEQRDLQAALASAQQELLDARALHEVTRRFRMSVDIEPPCDVFRDNVNGA